MQETLVDQLRFLRTELARLGDPESVSLENTSTPGVPLGDECPYDANVAIRAGPVERL